MSDTAKLILGDKTYEFPIRVGTEGNRVIDIAKLFNQTGHITLDEGFANTGEVTSEITYMDGDKGVLRLRGYLIEELTEKCDFLEVAYLLIYGNLPNEKELDDFRQNIRRHTLLHGGMQTLFSGFPPNAHPMAILAAMVESLAVFCPDALDPRDPRQADLAIDHLMAKMPTIAAFSYKQSVGQPFIYPQNDLSYCQNFLHMMFAVPSERYQMDPDYVDALNRLFILYADHGQVCSTATVRMVGSSGVNLFSAIAAGICAYWGDLHGGANEACLNFLEQLHAEGGNIGKYIDRAKNPNDPFQLPGFGHRVYNTYDPRAQIIKEACHRLMRKQKRSDPIFDLALELEEVAMKNPYFIERRVYPNVDFYSGIIYRIIGIPKPMFTVLLAIGRLPGWIAHWKELLQAPRLRIHRPRQLYVGPPQRKFTPLGKR
jgi:citrate synthase